MNEVIFHITGYSSLWNAPGHDTAYLIFIGLNIEIFLMFSCMGIIIIKTLPSDKTKEIYGISYRFIWAVGWALFCAIAEYILNQIGALGWEFEF